MFSSVRWPVTLALLSATLLAVGLAGAYLFGSVRAQFLRSSEANLRANAESIASLMGSHMDEVALTDFARTLIAREMKRLSGQVGARICVVNWKGDILEDSAPHGATNVKGLPEIEEALNGRYGSDVRDSTMLLAVPIKAHGKNVGAVYASRSLADMESMLSDLQHRLSLAGLWAAGLAVMLSLALGGFLIRPVRRLAEGVERISGGDYAYRLNLRRRDELGLLGRDIDAMASRLESHRNVLMQFVSDASHELKTPIASLKVLSEALSEGGLEDPKAGPRFVSHIHDEVCRMERLVGDMLALQRGDSGVPLDKQPMDLHALAETSLALWQARGEKGLNHQIPSGLMVNADHHRIGQVLTNLLENALNATRDAEDPQINLSAKAGKDGITVSVSDSGPGLPDSELERVFERFYRLDQGRTREQGGNGLGLAICRQIVEAHGGKIWAESSPRGAVFCFTLPV